MTDQFDTVGLAPSGAPDGFVSIFGGHRRHSAVNHTASARALTNRYARVDLPAGTVRARDFDMIVLIAEDERKTRELIASYLEGTSATGIHTARTGLEAVRMAGEIRPDVILIDGLLPELHGFEATRLIRNLDPSYKPLIILITAIYKKRSYENEARLKWGVDGYLHKPFTREQLLDAMKRSPASVQQDEDRPAQHR